MIGTRLSHYDIVSEISRGGMGVVYRAVDVNLGREVALKVLPEDVVHDPERRARLVQEARAASALEHPHIAVIHEVGDAGGVTFIAMELIRGEKLSETLSRGPVAHTRALALATEIAEALGRAHERAIIHRDLKPANVMITEDGHAKVIDFGLAKLLEPPDPAPEITQTGRAPRTGPGMILGTAAYMSPEQARGSRVDHRSDIFALGVTLFEMLAGRPAFRGQSTLDTLQAVLTQPVPALPVSGGVSMDANSEIRRIIEKATAKDPDERYQGMKDLVVDLRAARRRLESAPHAVVVPPSPPSGATVWSGRTRVLAGVAALAVVLAATVVWWRGRPEPAGTIVEPTGKPAVAVLYFDNNTGDPTLDWLRTGLTDMIVTDLSQSPEIEVVGTDRLVQILQDLKRADDRVFSADVVLEVANRAAADRVLLGSYVKAGNTIRISARLQDARTGRIMTAERVEGPGESSLFSLVDELTRRVKSRMIPASRTAAPLMNRPGDTPAADALDRGLTEITTSSIEAYRFYAEGINFHERGLYEQAEPLLERAIEIDPNFAMAYAKLAVLHHNLGMFRDRDDFAKRAIEANARLTTRERYYIEGFYYSLRRNTLDRSIKAYETGLKLHPEHQASRHNLGLAFFELGRFPEAIAQYEELLRRGTSIPVTYGNLSEALIQVGNIERAKAVAHEFAARYPENGTGHRLVGMVLIAEGRYEEARSALKLALGLNPSDFLTMIGRRTVAVLQERWDEAEEISRTLKAKPSPFLQFLGLQTEGFAALARGRGTQALEAWERSVRIEALGAQQRAAARNRIAMVLLREGRTTEALRQATLSAGEGESMAFDASIYLAIAQDAAGRKAESETTIARLESLERTLPGARPWRVHWARGEIALRAGDSATAIRELTEASQALPAHGPVGGPPSPHVDLWLALAQAYARAGNDAEAARWLEHLQASYDRAFAVDGWGRSFFLLGQIYERQGDTARARAQYAKFLELWGDGDLARDRIAQARQKLRILNPKP
jgi:tetratricopeptide (TPR) repeat protein/TolB-like protein/predicted Ser/Thr protein kinase